MLQIFENHLENDLIIINNVNVEAMENSSSAIFHTDGTWYFGDEVLLVLSTSMDEAPVITLSWTVKFLLIGIMLTSFVTGSFFKFITYSYVYRTNKINRGWMHRPLNVLLVTSDLVHHATHILAGSWYVICMVMEPPFSDKVGYGACWAFMVIGAFGVTYLCIGSLGMAIYRLLYIKNENWVKYKIGEKRLLFIVFFSSFAITTILVMMFTIEDSGDRSGFNMCTSLSVADTEIFMDYKMSTGANLLRTTYIRKVAIFIAVIAQMIEFSIYVWFFWYQHKMYNGKIAKLMKQEDVKERNAKNIGTFMGQFYGFMMEFAFLVFFLIIQFPWFYSNGNAARVRGIVTCLKFADFGSLSAIEVFSSPLLRSYMKSKTN